MIKSLLSLRKLVSSNSFSSPEPLVFRLKMSLTSGSGRAKKFEFFHLLTKNECAAEMKITKYYAFHFTSARIPRASPLWRAFQKNKYKLKHPETWRRRRRKFISFPVISAWPAMISFMTETILFCCLVAAKKRMRYRMSVIYGIR